jgi:hypothetical protein
MHLVRLLDLTRTLCHFLLISQLDARDIKGRADRSMRAARAWSPLSLLRYLEASLMVSIG